MRKLFFILLFLVLCEISVASSINGSLTTVFYNHENFVERFSKPRAFTIYEYLLINAPELAGDRMSLYVNLRLGGTFNGGELKPRLFPTYLVFSAPYETEVRLGRQFIPDEAGLFELDGVKVDKSLGDISLSLFGGSSFSPLSLHTERRASLGGNVSFGSFRKLQTKLGFLSSFDTEGLKRLIILGHLSSFRLAFHSRKRFNMFSGFGFDLVSKELSKLYLTAQFNPISNLNIYARYRHHRPLFSPDSIFSVFSYSSSDEIALETEYALLENLSLYASYSGLMFEDELNHSFSGGVNFKGLNVGFESLEDEVAHTRVKASFERVVKEKLSLSLSTYYSIYDIGEKHTAFSAFTSLGYSFKNLSFSLDTSYYKNPYYKYNFRVLGRVRWKFAYRR